MDRTKGVRTFLGDEEEGAGNGGFRGTDITVFQMVGDVFVQGGGFDRCKAINATVLHRGAGFQVNSMIPRLVGRKALGGLFVKKFPVLLELGRDLFNGGRSGWAGG